MKKILLTFSLFLIFLSLNGQGGIAISNSNASPDTSAILDVISTEKGFLTPRMTKEQRDSIKNPATGLLIYQIDSMPGFYYFDSIAWESIGGSGGTSNWTTLGTNIHNNNSGKVSIGTSSPADANLTVRGTMAQSGTIYDTIVTKALTTGNYTNIGGGLGSGYYSSPNYHGINIPDFLVENAISVKLDIRLIGDMGEGPNGGISFGSPIDVIAEIENTVVASSMTPPAGAVSNCTYYEPSTLFPGGNATGLDITSLALGKSSLAIKTEDFGGSYRTQNCQVIDYQSPFNGIVVEFRFIYEIPVFESALSVENGALQIKELISEVNSAVYVDTMGKMHTVPGDGDLMVRSSTGEIKMQNGIPGKLIIGGDSFPYYLGDTTPWGGPISTATLEVLGFGTHRPLYGGNIREYDSTGVIRIHSNGHLDYLDPISIHSEGSIAGGNFFAHSDARIKKVIGKSDNEKDLGLLNKVIVTDYKYKDSLAMGNKIIKKVIAQELKDIYPNAITYTSKSIPDIYKHCKIEDRWIYSNAVVQVGETLQLMVMDGDKELPTKVLVTGVKEGKFQIDRTFSANHVFVYGRYVHDFHIVDYDALTTLNISATQELSKKIDHLIEENQNLKSQLHEMQNIKAEVTEIKNLLSTLSNND